MPASLLPELLDALSLTVSPREREKEGGRRRETAARKDVGVGQELVRLVEERCRRGWAAAEDDDGCSRHFHLRYCTLRGAGSRARGAGTGARGELEQPDRCDQGPHRFALRRYVTGHIAIACGWSYVEHSVARC